MLKRFVQATLVVSLLAGSPAQAIAGDTPPATPGSEQPTEQEQPQDKPGWRETLKRPQLRAGDSVVDISANWVQNFHYYSDAPTPRLDEHEPFSLTRGFGMQLQALEIAFQAELDHHFRADLFLAFDRDGVEIEEGFLTAREIPGGFSARAGQFYTAFGQFNTVHFLEASPFVDMPLVNRRFFGGEQLRGLGAELSWELPLPWHVELTGSIQTADNDVSFGVPAESTESLRHFLTNLHLRQDWDISESLYLRLGGSFAQGPNDSAGPAFWSRNRTYLWGGDIQLRWHDRDHHRYAAFQAEYIHREAELPGGRLAEGGIYTAVEVCPDEHWQLAARFDYVGLPSTLRGPNPPLIANPELTGFHTGLEQWRIGSSVSYHFSEFVRLRMQYNYDKLALAGGVHELFGQLQFTIGQHGRTHEGHHGRHGHHD
ncbi:MAG: hypothetical protein KIT79_05790 [Deltaproteobacteria bacterium]|nr:hypothetical protein [Deltaproteobacteria bacterium]